jgi:hypothetical protein
MGQQTLNVGSNANDGTGDTLRSAMEKVNTMFTELYLSPLSGGDLSFSGNEISATRTNEDLVFQPSGTGAISFPAIRINDNAIEGTRSNENINLIPNGTGSVTFGAIKISGTTLSSDDSSSINVNDGLIVDGTISVSGSASITGAITAGTGSTIGNLTLADGSITDSSGAISFGNENLSTTGTMTAGTGSTIGNITLANGSITDSGGSISFGNENLSTTGTLTVEGLSTLGSLTVTGTTTITGTVGIDNINILDNVISTDSNADLRLTPGGTGSVVVSSLTLDDNINITDNEIKATASNSDLILSPSGTGNIIAGAITINGTTLSSTDSSTINLNEGLVVDGTANITGAVTAGSTLAVGTDLTAGGNLTVSGDFSVGGTLTVDNLTFNDSTISSSSNSNINITPGGTGVVNISNLTIDGEINITDNVIKTTNSNSDLVISPSGTGQVIMTKADIDEGTIDNTVIGGSTAVAGTFTTLSTTAAITVDGVTLTDNTISTNASNANLELTGNGTGGVTISGFTFPTSDGSNGQFIKTNGAGALSFASAGASLSHSDIADASVTVSASTASQMDSFAIGTYRSAKYFISITDTENSKFEFVEANVTHDGTNAFITTFGSVSSFAPDGSSSTVTPVSFSADINSGNVRVLVTNATSDSVVFKFQRIVIDV